MRNEPALLRKGLHRADYRILPHHSKTGKRRYSAGSLRAANWPWLTPFCSPSWGRTCRSVPPTSRQVALYIHPARPRPGLALVGHAARLRRRLPSQVLIVGSVLRYSCGDFGDGIENST